MKNMDPIVTPRPEDAQRQLKERIILEITDILCSPQVDVISYNAQAQEPAKTFGGRRESTGGVKTMTFTLTIAMPE